jgi:hypothetical protein
VTGCAEAEYPPEKAELLSDNEGQGNGEEPGEAAAQDPVTEVPPLASSAYGAILDLFSWV